MRRTLELRTALLIMGLLLLVGLVGGVLLDRLAWEYGFLRGRPERMEGRLMDRLQRELSLTAGQRTAVDSLFHEHRSRIERLRKVVEPMFSSRQDSLDAALARVLSPAQLEKLQKLAPRHGRRHHGIFGFPGPGSRAHGPRDTGGAPPSPGR
ncbi:MAG: hypothetical protein HZB25_13970 [Candidatus Eisenbacteria bacterium]|nr:hypothetical protein [Candidatus Eisenbacteria bacterium]